METKSGEVLGKKKGRRRWWQRSVLPDYSPAMLVSPQEVALKAKSRENEREGREARGGEGAPF